MHYGKLLNGISAHHDRSIPGVLFELVEHHGISETSNSNGQNDRGIGEYKRVANETNFEVGERKAERYGPDNDDCKQDSFPGELVPERTRVAYCVVALNGQGSQAEDRSGTGDEIGQVEHADLG